MTDTDFVSNALAVATIARVEAETEAILAEHRQETEDFERKKAEVRRVAVELGDDNSIGEPLDDLLAEFDMPPRPRTNYLAVQVCAMLPLGEGAQRNLPIQNGATVYVAPGRTRIVTPFIWTGQIPQSPVAECSCGSPAVTDAVMQWAVDAYGIEAARGMHLQIGARSCDGGDCENPAAADAIEGPLVDVPVIAWREPTPTTEEAQPEPF